MKYNADELPVMRNHRGYNPATRRLLSYCNKVENYLMPPATQVIAISIFVMQGG